MKIVERIIRGTFLFLFGLITGGMGMWLVTMGVLKVNRHNSRAGYAISYRDYYSDRKILNKSLGGLKIRSPILLYFRKEKNGA